jgi:predicted RNase H-like nuclease (RuvC/YqgF family)
MTSPTQTTTTSTEELEALRVENQKLKYQLEHLKKSYLRLFEQVKQLSSNKQ